MKIRWLRGAIQSLRAIHAHIAIDSPEATGRVVRKIQSAERRLLLFPSSGRQGHVAGTMELVIPDLPYVVVYRIEGETLDILRVVHTSMDWPEHLS
ncbi:type II toxin-antitoxin system RelE/ParE family toxin [Tautonia rosea]|uniref:type II toxin-antitoxin system RelE/ParE family toxin n=1 Tax=Tautonia rosea TaxID=2728037 RepID=UPI0014742DD6|nr:type II toxin-antitoxin system RelE/ParE family toxin [Tautonia rosea]